MTLSPIALFVYNRPEHTKKTVAALQKNTLAKESDLFIFSDGPKENSAQEVASVRAYIKTITGFKNIVITEREKNIGLAESIISGVTEIVNRYGKVIVVEDDLVSSPYFLEYMNEALDLYEKEERVISIHGYLYPTARTLPETFFLRGADCWGWATWKRGWDLFEKDGKKLLSELESKKLISKFDMDNSFHYSLMLKKQIEGKNNSWAIRWHASAFVRNMFTLYPGKSLINNIGQDKSGTHIAHANIHNTQIYNDKIKVGDIEVKENQVARKVIVKYFKSLRPNIFQRIVQKLLS